MNRVDFSHPKDQVFTLSHPPSTNLEQIARCALPFLIPFPAGRTALKGLYFLLHTKEILSLSLNQNPHESLSPRQRTSLQTSAFKAFLIWGSLKNPHDYALLRNLFELCFALHSFLKNIDSYGNLREFSIALSEVFYRLFLFLSISQKITKIQILHVWTLLALVSLFAKELLCFSKQTNHFEKISSLFSLLGIFAQSANLALFLKSQSNCTAEFIDLTKGFITNTANLLLEPENFGFFVEGQLKLVQLKEFVESWARSLELPLILVRVLGGASFLFQRGDDNNPLADVGTRLPPALPLEKMSGWTTQKTAVHTTLDRLKNPRKYPQITTPIRFLLCGVPGTGKTAFARSFAASSGHEAFMFSGTDSQLVSGISKIPAGRVVIIEEVGTKCQNRTGAPHLIRHS